MKLFLASEGSDPKTIKKLEEYVGGFVGKNVVYIPTARNGENPYNTWHDSDTLNFLNSSGMNVSIVQLEDYKRGIDQNLFENKDLIWVTGGTPGYLMYWILRTGLDVLLPRLLEKSVYVGSSGGAMITGVDLNVMNWYPNEIERGAEYLP